MRHVFLFLAGICIGSLLLSTISARQAGDGKMLWPLTTSASLDFGATATGACDSLTITVTGAADGDVVTVGIPSALVNADPNGYFRCYVSATNTVTVSRCNRSLLSVLANPSAATVKVMVHRF